MSASLKGGLDPALLAAAIERAARGAMKAGADVIAEGARENCRSADVRSAIKTKVQNEPDQVIATVYVDSKVDGAYVAPWLEHGTDPHFISVDPELSGGRTAGRVNRQARNGDGEVAATLLINGKPVGKTVHHPGAQPHPFMRPAADEREAAAISTIGQHIAAKLTAAGIATPAAESDGE